MLFLFAQELFVEVILDNLVDVIGNQRFDPVRFILLVWQVEGGNFFAGYFFN